jgi:hypothetical protein
MAAVVTTITDSVVLVYVPSFAWVISTQIIYRILELALILILLTATQPSTRRLWKIICSSKYSFEEQTEKQFGIVEGKQLES